MIPFEFTRPLFLTLLIPVGLILGHWYRRSLSDFPRSQKLASLVTRSTIAALLIFSLSGLTWLNSTSQQFVLFVVDQSRSVGENGQQRIAEYLADAEAAGGEHRIAFLPFASTPGRVQSRSVMEQFPDEKTESAAVIDSGAIDSGVVLPSQPMFPVTAADQSERTDGTDIAAAIKAAAGYVPAGYVPQIILLSDGNQTDGDAVAAAAQSRIPVSAVPLPARSEPEVQVSEVNVPAEVREGEPFFVDVTISSTHEDQGRIEVFRGDHLVVSEQKNLQPGENRFRFTQSVERDRMAMFRVRVSGLQHDTLIDNNSDFGLVTTSGKPRVLIVESDPDLIRELVYALEDEGIEADLRPPQGMPDSLAALQNYELLILSNVPATALTQQQMMVTRTWVRDLGGGFMMLGGENSFGLGGYYRSTLEDILPVRSDFEKEKEKPSLGMVLVIDRSGSMDGEKLDMARTAARSAVELLSDRDQIAVLAFDDQTRVISEMQSAGNRGRISEDISRIESGGGTSMYPAMQLSFEMLNAVSAKLKHVIMLTDGVSNPGDFEGLAQQMSAARITISTVAVGGESDTDSGLLESIARIGRGRYYHAEDASRVPQIFAKETVTASRSAIDEQPFIPQVIRTTRALADVDLESAPFLLGYVTTRPKPTSEVILATEKGDPLLAWWRYGLGMTAAFTSDAKSRWAAEWLTWPGYGKFWTQVVRQTMRHSDSKGIRVSTTRQGRKTQVQVDALTDSGLFVNQAELQMTVIDPGLRQSVVTLQQTAPGQYSTEIATAQTGAWILEFALNHSGQELYRQSRGLVVGYNDELRVRPASDSLLREIAAVSGGRFDPTPAEVFAPASRRAIRPLPIRPWLLTLAALLLVLDVALRRIDIASHFPMNRPKVRA